METMWGQQQRERHVELTVHGLAAGQRQVEELRERLRAQQFQNVNIPGLLAKHQWNC